MKILFICNSNVGRSQAAEAIFNSQVTDGEIAISAGTIVNEDHGQILKDRPGAVGMLTALEELGIDAKEKTRTQLTEGLLEDVEVIVVMADRDTWPAYLAKDPRLVVWEVPLDDITLESSRIARDLIATHIKETFTSNVPN